MSERMYRDQADQLHAEIAKLEKRRADEAGRLARLRQEIGRIKNSITKSTSASTLRLKEGQIAGKEGQAADLEKKIAGYASDLATKHRQLTTAECAVHGPAPSRRYRWALGKALERRQN